jgi:hypothetical protein
VLIGFENVKGGKQYSLYQRFLQAAFVNFTLNLTFKTLQLVTACFLDVFCALRFYASLKIKIEYAAKSLNP